MELNEGEDRYWRFSAYLGPVSFSPLQTDYRWIAIQISEMRLTEM